MGDGCSPTLRFGQCQRLCSVADKRVEGTLSDLFNLLLWHTLSLSPSIMLPQSVRTDWRSPRVARGQISPLLEGFIWDFVFEESMFPPAHRTLICLYSTASLALDFLLRHHAKIFSKSNIITSTSVVMVYEMKVWIRIHIYASNFQNWIS